jgi:uncharacterized protein (TIGR02147 family)
MTQQLNRDEFFSLSDYRAILEREYELRRARRSNYTLRAFARDLGISSSRLCAILKKRYGLAAESAKFIAKKIGFDDEKINYFIDLVEVQHSRSEVARVQAADRIKKMQNAANYRNAKDVQLLDQWYYAAILELINTRDGQIKSAEVAKLLGISSLEANEAIKMLIKMGEIKKTKSGFAVNDDFITVKGETPQKTIREYHAQLLEQTKQAIQREPIPKRKNLSTVFAFDSSDSERAREWLSKMHQKFMDEFGVSKNPDKVYALGIHLVPLEKSEEKVP